MVEENKPDGKDAGEADPYANDPFFKRIFDGQWHACIGVAQITGSKSLGKRILQDRPWRMICS
jgi:hypothetical protein